MLLSLLLYLTGVAKGCKTDLLNSLCYLVAPKPHINMPRVMSVLLLKLTAILKVKDIVELCSKAIQLAVGAGNRQIQHRDGRPFKALHTSSRERRPAEWWRTRLASSPAAPASDWEVR